MTFISIMVRLGRQNRLLACILILIVPVLVLGQERQFAVDSLTAENVLFLKLSPIGSPRNTHQLEFQRSESGEVFVRYNFPILWMGEGMGFPEPVGLDNRSKIWVNMLIQHAQKVQFMPAVNSQPEKIFVYNWYAQPYWQALYQRLESELFGDYIRKQIQYRESAIQQESLKYLGEFKAQMKLDTTCDLLNIWLTRSPLAKSGEQVDCKWTIQHDEIRITGSCQNGLTGVCSWQLMPVMGTWRIVLEGTECKQLYGKIIPLNFAISFVEDGTLFLTTYDPIMFFQRQVKEGGK